MTESNTPSLAFIYTLIGQGLGTQEATSQQISCMRYAAQSQMTVTATFFDTVPPGTNDGTASGEEISAHLVGLRALTSTYRDNGGTVLVAETTTTTPMWKTIENFLVEKHIPYTIATKTPAGTAGGSW